MARPPKHASKGVLSLSRSSLPVASSKTATSTTPKTEQISAAVMVMPNPNQLAMVSLVNW
jgi:hypothetical protein